jgi:hypothetical protein
MAERNGSSFADLCPSSTTKWPRYLRHRTQTILCSYGVSYFYQSLVSMSLPTNADIFSRSIITTSGRKLLRTWFLRPLLDIDAIRERHDAVEILSHTDQNYTIVEIRDQLRGIHDITRYCTKIRRGTGKYQDWLSLSDVRCSLFICCVRDVDQISDAGVYWQTPQCGHGPLEVFQAACG